MKESFGPLWIIPALMILVALVWYAIESIKYARELKLKNDQIYRKKIEEEYRKKIDSDLQAAIWENEYLFMH